MNIILLSGGSGKRLWPLSNDVKSKQFIPVFKTGDGMHESMVQRVYRQIKEVNPEAVVTIATSEKQVPLIKDQLGDNVGISIEPARRDTFPAIALATAYLSDVMKVDSSETVIVCPVDPFVNNDYFQALSELSKQVDKQEANLVLMGIEPTYPAEKYGYIIPKTSDVVSDVDLFKEKPTSEVAMEYIAQGALWNGGVFAFKLSYLLKKAHELMDFSDYQSLYDKYGSVPKISFDYAVVEHEDRIQVQRFSGEWIDLGTWDSFTEVIEEKIIGKGYVDVSCKDVNIINETELPVVAVGLENVIISVSEDGILVAEREKSADIKKIVEGI